MPAPTLSGVCLYAVTGPASADSAWSRAGSAAAELIVRGQTWRAVTALTKW
jgi:hypothetical protein